MSHGPRELPVYTAEELLLILDRYSASTGVWDPLVNGTTQGRAMTEHERWTHDMAVGQRTVIGSLRRAIAQGDLRRASREHWSRAEKDPVAPMAGEGIVDNGWRECCAAYVAHCQGLIVEWLHEDHTGDTLDPDGSITRQSALDTMNTIAAIIRGEYEYRATSDRVPMALHGRRVRLAELRRGHGGREGPGIRGPARTGTDPDRARGHAVSGPWLNLIGFAVGVILWVVGLATHRRSMRFLGIGFTISNAVLFVLMAIVWLSLQRDGYL